MQQVDVHLRKTETRETGVQRAGKVLLAPAPRQGEELGQDNGSRAARPDAMTQGALGSSERVDLGSVEQVDARTHQGFEGGKLAGISGTAQAPGVGPNSHRAHAHLGGAERNHGFFLDIHEDMILITAPLPKPARR